MPQIASQNSFDFEKGCYVGQEVVSRMNTAAAPASGLCASASTGRRPRAGRLSWMGSRRSGR